MDGGLHGVRERKRAAETELRDIERQLKLARRRDKAAQASSARAWTLRGQLLNETLLIFVHADCHTDPAAQHLMRKARQFHWPTKELTEVAALVSAAFLEVDFETLARLCDEDSPSDELALARAMDVVQQWSLAQWVTTQNYKGVAPSTASVLDHWDDTRAGVPERVRPASWGASTDGAARMRATRWRRRFCGRFAKLPVRDDVPLPTMREKARQLSQLNKEHPATCTIRSVYHVAASFVQRPSATAS